MTVPHEHSLSWTCRRLGVSTGAFRRLVKTKKIGIVRRNTHWVIPDEELQAYFWILQHSFLSIQNDILGKTDVLSHYARSIPDLESDGRFLHGTCPFCHAPGKTCWLDPRILDFTCRACRTSGDLGDFLASHTGHSPSRSLALYRLAYPIQKEE